MKKIVLISLISSLLSANTFFSDSFSTSFDDEFKKMNELSKKFFDNSFAQPFYDFRGFDKQFTKVNIYTKDDKYFVEFDVSGSKKEDLKLSLDENILKLEKIQEKKETKKDDKNYVRKEFFYGSESRSVMLPNNLILSDLKTKFNNGLLTVTIPMKKDIVKPQLKYIPIN